MHAMIGRLRAQPGRRDELARRLVDEVGVMPGCVSYLVMPDPDHEDAIGIAEAWTSADAHRAWLASDHVRALVNSLAPLMIGYDIRIEGAPSGGHTRGITLGQ